MKKILLTILLASIISCKGQKNESVIVEKTDLKVFNDSSYVVNSQYPKNDVRRYGLTAETATQTHHFTGKSNLLTVLDLAEQTGEEMFFPPGYYGMNLTLDSRQNMKLNFDHSEFHLIHITQVEDSLPKPKNIRIKGTLIAYARLGITEASNIDIDSVLLRTNLEKNLWKLRNTGCHIYHGCKDIKINYLEVDDFGSGDKRYQYNHAALSIDGWNNNPENVQIKKIHIKSTDRHGIYMTGKDHLIGDVIIDKFGVGNALDMAPMQDAKKGEEADFKALWLNKCYDSFIENITINEKASKGKYTAHFDEGDKNRPVTIGHFKVENDNNNIEILEEKNHGVIIEWLDK